MTKSKYYVYLALKNLGLKVSQRMLSDATHEMHLLKDAQELIGFYNSDHVESIDELKTEYWEIKNLKQQIAQIEEQEEAMEDKLYTAIGKTSEIATQDQETIENLQDEIDNLIDRREEQLEKRNSIFNEGKRVRKIYDGLKAKMEYFMNDAHLNSPEREDTKKRLDNAITELNILKSERDSIVLLIANIESKIDHKQDALDELNTNTEKASFTNSNDVGGTNKVLSELRSDKANLLSELDKNVRYVGRFLFANRHDQQVNACIKVKKELVHQASALRKSVLLNHKIVDNKVNIS